MFDADIDLAYGITFEMVKKPAPDAMLLDLGLKNHDSFIVVESIWREFPEAHVVIMDLAPVPPDA